MDLLQIAPALHRLRIPSTAAHKLNCYVWLGPTGVTMIDTGWPDSLELVDVALHRLGIGAADIERIVLTHCHDDHVGTAADLVSRAPHVEVVAGADDAAVIRGERLWPMPVLTAAERTLHPVEPGSSPPPPPCRVDVEVGAGESVELPGGAVALHVGGHTPGSIAVYLPGERAVLTGDLAAESDGAAIVGVFNTDRAQSARAIARLAELDVDVAGFGHGDAIVSGAAASLAVCTDPFA